MTPTTKTRRTLALIEEMAPTPDRSGVAVAMLPSHVKITEASSVLPTHGRIFSGVTWRPRRPGDHLGAAIAALLGPSRD